MYHSDFDQYKTIIEEDFNDQIIKTAFQICFLQTIFDIQIEPWGCYFLSCSSDLNDSHITISNVKVIWFIYIFCLYTYLQ